MERPTQGLHPLVFAGALLCLAALIACSANDSTSVRSDGLAPLPFVPPSDSFAPPLDSAMPSGWPLLTDTGATPGGRLAFTFRPKGGHSQINVIRSDGTGMVQLTHGADDSDPAWSPDGEWIAFERYTTPQIQRGIWLVKADGSAEVHVSSAGYLPFWLEDGRVGFSCEVGMCAVRRDGTKLAILAVHRGPVDSYDDSYAVSPDGRLMAFVRNVSDGWDQYLSSVYVANRDGTGEHRISRDDDVGSYPTWSSDGRLAFDSWLHGVTVVDADGGRLHSVSYRDSSAISPSLHGFPAWSPDGARIMFGQLRTFYFANANGTGAIRRVRTAWQPGFAAGDSYGGWSWSPR